MNRPIFFEIGRTSLGNLVKIPEEQDNKTLESFVEGFSLSEQSDIFCMTEFLTHKFKDRVSGGPEQTLTAEVFSIGYRKFKYGLFQEQLNERNLPTSAARIIYGRSLCHIAYQE